MCSKLTIKTPEQRLINFYSPEIIKKPTVSLLTWNIIGATFTISISNF